MNIELHNADVMGELRSILHSRAVTPKEIEMRNDTLAAMLAGAPQAQLDYAAAFGFSPERWMEVCGLYALERIPCDHPDEELTDLHRDLLQRISLDMLEAVLPNVTIGFHYRAALEDKIGWLNGNVSEDVMLAHRGRITKLLELGDYGFSTDPVKQRRNTLAWAVLSAIKTKYKDEVFEAIASYRMRLECGGWNERIRDHRVNVWAEAQCRLLHYVATGSVHDER